MTAQLQIQLLGDFRLDYAGKLITALQAGRPQSLLAYLLLHRRAPQSRSHVAFLLWPDSSEEQAFSNLRNLLHKLRHTIPNADHFLVVDNLTVQWRPDAPFRLDVAEFEAAVAQSQQAADPQTAQAWLEQALASYSGDLLPSHYDDWVITRREELRRQHIEALHKLIGLLEQQGEYRTALRYAQRLLQQDPLDETVYLLQMRLYALSGDRAGIRRVYQSCVDLLARELDTAPSPTTQEAYEHYLRAPLPAPPTRARPVEPLPVDDTRSNTPTPAPAHRPRPLPSPRTGFLGRQRELAEIALRLAEPTCRLLTVIGPGGVGKTRLALETAKSQQSVFADGVAFVPLAPLESVAQISTAMADALNFSCQGDASPTEQVCHYLREKVLLLVLDNFEHLLAGAELLSTILAETAAVKLLVTSRERLNLQEEWLFALEGLPVPAEQATAEETDAGADNEAAVALFRQSAQRVRQEFTPTSADQVAIRQLCALVDGVPLSIELAATWVRLLSCTEIVREIQQSLDFLATTLRNVPARHRSLRAVFDQSWALMTPEEQQLFRRLACFRGGFTREAAAEVAGATLPLLSALADKSLLQQMRAGRFGFHQLLRQYAHERLTETGETAEMRNRHLRFFARYATAGGPAYGRTPAWLAQIGAEYENLWAALHWATTGGDVEAGLQLAFSLHAYWEMRGYWREEYEWLTRLLALPSAEPPTLLRGRLLLHAGHATLHLVDSTTAAGYYTESLAMARQQQSPPDVVRALIGLGDSQQDHAAAQALYTEGLALSREIDFPEGTAHAITCLGHLTSGAGNYAAAAVLYQEALTIQQKLGDRLAATGLLRALGITAFLQKSYAEAQAIYEECLRVYRELGNQPGVMAMLNDLADVALVNGDYGKAQALYGESLALANDLGNKWMMAWNVESLAKVAVQEGAYERAATLFGSAERLFQSIAARLRQDDVADHERLVALVRAQLGAERFALHAEQGRTAPLDQAIAFALASSVIRKSP